MVFAYGLVPLATTAQLGETTIAENPITYGVVSVQQMFGGASGLVTAVLCGALFLSMISSSADAGRALYGIAQEDMTITQFGRLNRRGMPAVALVVTMVVNLVIVVFVGSPVAILIASNIGYILAVTLAVVGFLLLRRDRPAWPRPIKLGRAWIPVAVVIAVFNAGILVIGATNPALSYAGGFKEVLIGLALLLSGVVLFAYRRLAQDRGRLTLREETPAVPGADI
jgi:amino acid transporter